MGLGVLCELEHTDAEYPSDTFPLAWFLASQVQERLGRARRNFEEHANLFATRCTGRDIVDLVISWVPSDLDPMAQLEERVVDRATFEGIILTRACEWQNQWTIGEHHEHQPNEELVFRIRTPAPPPKASLEDMLEITVTVTCRVPQRRR